MLASLTKLVLIISLLSTGLSSYAQDLTSDTEQKPKDAKANIQIKVDANTYNFNTIDNSFSTKSDSKNVEIKDNVDSNINTENKNSSINTENKDSNISTDLSKDKNTETEIKDSQITNKESSDITKDSTVSEEIKTSSPEIVVEPKTEKVEVTSEPKVIIEPVKTDTTVKDVEPAVKEEVTPVIIISEPVKESFEEPIAKPVTEIVKESVKHKSQTVPFSIRGSLGYGLFTSIDDISTNYSFGFAIGHELNNKLSVEFQYIFSEFEDNYNYSSYYGIPISGYKFSQNDFAALLNYKLISNHDFSIYAIGGLNYALRKADNSFTGDTNSANSFSAVFGLGTDIKINKDLSFNANFNYNLNLTSSGYNQISSPLYLASGEDYVIFNFGLKYKF